MDIQWIAAQFPQLSGLQPLAQGGQKVVFAAQHVSDGDVVLKLLLRASDEQRLEREVLAGQLVECEPVEAHANAITGSVGQLLAMLSEHMRDAVIDRIEARQQLPLVRELRTILDAYEQRLLGVMEGHR